MSPAFRLLLVLLCAAVGGCQFARSDRDVSASEEPALVVAAAMSLQEPVSEIVANYERRTGRRIQLHLAGSNRLAHQIEAARQQDVFLSASPEWSDYLVKAGIAPSEHVSTLATNRLVVVVHERSSIDGRDLNDLRAAAVRRFSLAEPRGVPAGRYAKAALQSAGLWETVQRKLVPGSNVRSALQLVTADLRVAGFVYRTDAAHEPRVRTLFEIPEEQSGAIRYTMSALRRGDVLRRGGALRGDAAPRTEALDFIEYCKSPFARATLSRHGFGPP